MRPNLILPETIIDQKEAKSSSGASPPQKAHWQDQIRGKRQFKEVKGGMMNLTRYEQEVVIDLNADEGVPRCFPY